jgi:hypothetical protein
MASKGSAASILRLKVYENATGRTEAFIIIRQRLKKKKQ